MPTMTQTERPVKATSIGFLLLDNFTLISLASAIEPLRMANQLTGKELYQWYTLTPRAEAVRASDGLNVTPDVAMETAPALDMIVVCGGLAPSRAARKEHLTWLRQQADRQRKLGAICTGSWVLASAGLLDHYEASTHWECIAGLQEAFPRVDLSSRLFSIDRDRFTASGGTAPLDMMLNIIAKDHGKELAAGISDMFIYEHVRGEQDQQRIPLKHMLGSNQPKLLEIVSLMESNLEELLTLDELANYAALSRRQLERLFQKNLNCSPSRYYMKLRLNRARSLLKQSSLSIIEVASACGFVSTPHFSKCYREQFGVPPRSERLGSMSLTQTAAPKVLLVTAQGQTQASTETYLPSRGSAAFEALVQARDEPTFASVHLSH